MGDHIDIEQVVANPELLVEFCQKVVDRIRNKCEGPSCMEKEIQLQEIAQAIKNMEKKRIPVPDVLRSEKIRLAAALDNQQKTETELRIIVDGLGRILTDIRSRSNVQTVHKENGIPRKKRAIQNDGGVDLDSVFDALNGKIRPHNMRPKDKMAYNKMRTIHLIASGRKNELKPDSKWLSFGFKGDADHDIRVAERVYAENGSNYKWYLEITKDYYEYIAEKNLKR